MVWIIATVIAEYVEDRMGETNGLAGGDVRPQLLAHADRGKRVADECESNVLWRDLCGHADGIPYGSKQGILP
jgi:hypothetical protein